MTIATLLAILRRARRRDQPRVIVAMDVYGPDDRRAVKLEMTQ